MRKVQPRSSLRLSSQDMRKLGYRVVDMIVQHYETLRDKPVTRVVDRSTLERLLREPIPETGTDFDALLDRVRYQILDNIMHLDHPRFFAYVPGPSNFVSVMADALATGFNVFAGSWLEASGAAEVELVTIDWLRQLCGLPEAAGGSFVSGGSIANLTALAVARHIKLKGSYERAIVYCSDQTHSSIKRAINVLGFQPTQFRVLPSDEGCRLIPNLLRHEVARDRESGKIPFCVVANAGTTNTGAVDPLDDLATLCWEEGLWLHVDAAYGGGAIVCDDGRCLLQGLDKADSLAIDPHKWLFQPYEMGAVLVKDANWLRDTFLVISDYGEDEVLSEEEVNYCDYGLQLTRHFRALKLWMSLKAYGIEVFRKAVAHGIHLAEVAQGELANYPNLELTSPAQLGIVTFRYIENDLSMPKLNDINRKIVTQCIADRFAMLSSTKLKGMVVLRLCTINSETTGTDIQETIARIVSYGVALRKIE